MQVWMFGILRAHRTASAVGLVLAAAIIGTASYGAAAQGTERGQAKPTIAVLQHDFTVFSRGGPKVDPMTVASAYPILQQELDNMMQPNDPSYSLQLNFSDAVLKLTPQAPEVLIPGTLGACVLAQVPAGKQPNQYVAIAGCNTTSNITANGYLGGVYRGLFKRAP